jgi:23S rRNA (guanine745-N1)-methyltransferase
MALACTVRNCWLPLRREGRAYRCDARHSFDIARQGYVNLLQPQDRRSPRAGDSPASVDARASLLAAGIGVAALDAMRSRAALLLRGLPSPVAVELGCGSGDLVGSLSSRGDVSGVGIDLSVAAVERAARQYPDTTWVVANADRRLPIVDASTQLVLSLHARRNPTECARILRPGGMLLVAIPAADDLIELRALAGGTAVERDRGEALRVEHAPLFDVVDRTTVRETRQLGRDALLALLTGTYRGARERSAERMRAVEALEVTLAADVWTFRRRDAVQARRFVPTNTS